LIDVEEKESVVNEKNLRDKVLSVHVEHLDKAGILFSHSLLDEMFAEDVDIEKLKHLPGVKELVEQFRVTFKAFSEEFIRAALEKYDRKCKEIEDFETAVKKMRNKVCVCVFVCVFL